MLRSMATDTVRAGDTSGGTTPSGSHVRMRAAAVLTSAFALAGVFLVGSPGAHAATIDVSTTSDGGDGSLRAAISEANANPGPDVIQVPSGTYTLTIAGPDEDNNGTGDLDTNGDVTI